MGLGCGLLVNVAVEPWGAASRRRPPGPADRVTLARATLACAVAALATESSPSHTVLLVLLATVALVLDAVDGRVARATRTESGFGARFDGEADAFLILVLSVHVATSYGAWVLVIGAARYAFWVAGLAYPWLRDPLPPAVAQGRRRRPGGRARRRRCGRATGGVVAAALLVALGLLAESFGRDVLWLARHRHARGARLHAAPPQPTT